MPSPSPQRPHPRALRSLRGPLALLIALSAALGPSGARAQMGAAGAVCEQPNVLFVLDYSGSMNQNNKWGQAVDSLTQVTIAFDARLRFGIMHFPTDGRCGVDNALWSPVQPNGGAAVRQNLMGRSPDGATPLGRAVREARSYYNALNDRARKNIIVVISDGGDTCSGGEVNEAREAFNQGYPVYVIGFGQGVNPQSLQGMAREGGTQQYYQADNSNQLFAALQTIAQNATSEVCDGADNDCDMLIDEQLAPVPCETMCGLGEKLCVNGQLSSCAGGLIPQESCDGSDNDCDGVADEVETAPCTTADGQPGSAACLPEGRPADECLPDNPDRTEVCDGRDNDVDGLIDEQTERECNIECHYGRVLCVEGQLLSCTAAPVTEETCNGFDDDCDGLLDEMATCVGGEVCGPEGLCLQPCASGECPVGFRCGADDYCHPPACPTACPQGFRCLNQECVVPCSVTSQCEAYGMLCDFERRVCARDPNGPASGGAVDGPGVLDAPGTPAAPGAPPAQGGAGAAPGGAVSTGASCASAAGAGGARGLPFALALGVLWLLSRRRRLGA